MRSNRFCGIIRLVAATYRKPKGEGIENSMNFICENCKKPCAAKMYESGIGADCCEEAFLLIDDDGLLRQLTAEEEIAIVNDWWEETIMEMPSTERARQCWLNRF